MLFIGGVPLEGSGVKDDEDEVGGDVWVSLARERVTRGWLTVGFFRLEDSLTGCVVGGEPSGFESSWDLSPPVDVAIKKKVETRRGGGGKH